MRYVLLKDAEPGMCTAYNVYDSYEHILISAGISLTKTYIEKLRKYGFEGVYIIDELSEDIKVEQVISPELRAKGLARVREKNVEKCQSVSVDIVEEILGKDVLSLDLTDLRTFDDYTYAHSVNVAVLCCIIGLGLKLKAQELRQIVVAALLHDIGKQSVPTDILNKPERLTPEEYEVMKSHAKTSYELVKNRKDLPVAVKTAILHHHENVDGSGYPQGIEGNDLSLLAKILHVADVYDALTSARPYKAPYSPYEASEYLMGACGIMFDKEVVQALLRFVPLYPKGSMVKLSNGQRGIIFDNVGHHNLRPVIRLTDGTMFDLEDEENLNVTIIHDAEEEDVVESELARKQMLREAKRYKVVVVDDMNTNLQLARGMLKNLYDVSLFKSGQQLLDYLDKHKHPDLILMDIDMPEMDGIETAKRVQEKTCSQVPIMFVSAICNRETVMMCREMNAAGYIIRPYNQVFMKSEIKRVLTGRSDAD